MKVRARSDLVHLVDRFILDAPNTEIRAYEGARIGVLKGLNLNHFCTVAGFAADVRVRAILVLLTDPNHDYRVFLVDFSH